MPTTRAEQGESTRRRLVQVASELFAEKGFDATPVEEILARAGVSKGALYHHFPSKEALFEAVTEETERLVLDRVAEATREAKDPLEMLRMGCAAWLDLTMDPAVRRISLIDGPAVLGWHRWRELDEKYGFGVVKKGLQAAMDAGLIHRQPAELIAHIVLAALGEAAMVIARSDDTARARREAGEAVEHLFDGMAVRKD